MKTGKMPNIYWLIIDSVRTYKTGLDDRDRIDILDEVGKDATEFLNCVTGAPSSLLSAGAMFTGETFEKAKVLGIDLHEYLYKYDSYVAFKKLGSLLISGPTGVNVNDIRAIIVR